ncbi:Uncharacterised protein [Mycobacterium tuberculosis]|uniref:Uncharacterized protein n=2 Tax=Mycobacterium tuberculosis TaxID=1773 RepID=A0A655DHZ9_MYCTX|nr:Uncharacterised protein [Mycobacterium tuberculosis]CFE50221.1 Uncharacterised protein [Mycobacterium tuberculosis]CKP71749.1 Uncharacterised protein [Mycobacterium tuberculosis]CKR45762.1 Uncharacterised protein [Mycobacterium tuberculosis]CKR86933.1 Uncharacterised protein [Mycobacterium tuberculosis]
MVSKPSLAARARPSLSGSMPTIQRGSSHSDRSSLYSRSVLIFPDPTIATFALDGMLLPLFERQPDQTQPGEVGDKLVAGPRLDRERA